MADEYNRSPLHYVCIDNPEETWVDLTKSLIQSGEDVNAQDRNGWTPLHFAAQAGSIGAVELLIDAGADINLRNSDGNTALWVATMNSYHGTQVIELLLKKGANPKEKNNYGNSAYDISPELFNKQGE